MNLFLYFRGENGKIDTRGPYFFDLEQVNKLGQDFEDYCKPSKSDTNTKKGAWYRCKDNNKDMVLFIKFDEIVYIGP
jgi:hypothetical protein